MLDCGSLHPPGRCGGWATIARLDAIIGRTTRRLPEQGLPSLAIERYKLD